jgi:type II secretory pathway predicted ATPase ExeA
MLQKLQGHWGFTRLPFGRDLAPSMLHRHAAHNEAVARITWTVNEHALAVITGEVGAGKTVAVRAALAGLDPVRHVVIYLGNPSVGARGIHFAIVTALGQAPRFHTAALIPQAADALASEHAERGRTPVLVIDLCRTCNYADTGSRPGRIPLRGRAPGRVGLGCGRHSYRSSRKARMLSGGR